MVTLLPSCCFFQLLDSSSTRENPVLSDDDGHFAVSIAVIAPRCNFFQKLTEGKSVNVFFAFVASGKQGLILFGIRILTQARSFCIIA
jgi:hypothetical protein